MDNEGKKILTLSQYCLEERRPFGFALICNGGRVGPFWRFRCTTIPALRCRLRRASPVMSSAYSVLPLMYSDLDVDGGCGRGGTMPSLVHVEDTKLSASGLPQRTTVSQTGKR